MSEHDAINPAITNLKREARVYESDAKIFIASEVDNLLWKRLALIASIFGIANIIALIALWANITSEAHKVAEQQVKTAATEFATQKLERFTEITDEAKARISGVNADYSNLYKTIGETDVRLKLLQSNREALEANLSNLTQESARLRTSIEAVKTSDIARFTQVVAAFNSLSTDESKTLINKIVEWKMQLDEMRANPTVMVGKTREGVLIKPPFGTISDWECVLISGFIPFGDTPDRQQMKPNSQIVLAQLAIMYDTSAPPRNFDEVQSRVKMLEDEIDKIPIQGLKVESSPDGTGWVINRLHGDVLRMQKMESIRSDKADLVITQPICYILVHRALNTYTK